MLATLYQIDFIDAAGTATRLLTAGDLTSDDLDFPMTAPSETYASLGLTWGGGAGLPGARRSLSWTRIEEHASQAAAAGYAIRHPATLPINRAGKLRVTISGGETWELADAVIAGASCRMTGDGIFATAANYQATAGAATPTAGLAWFSGIPTGWILETHGAIARTHAAS